jgi:hypothetical protein
MRYFDYTDLPAFLHDEELIRLLAVDVGWEELRQRFLSDDFLVADPSMKIPFFAEVHDYVGACERGNPGQRWIIKEIAEDDGLGAAMGSLCFFLDSYVRAVSAPTIVTRVGGKVCKATKIITKAEQLGSAGWAENARIREQLLLDLVNRWIYCDEDRNPNNYLIRSTSRGDQVVIAIDFSNVDLLFPGTKIKGRSESFGWEKIERTRALTPLKVEHFQGCDMAFFNMRFDGFARVGRKMLVELCKGCLRFQPDHAAMAKTITDNVLKRIEYVREYFTGQLPTAAGSEAREKYRDVGTAFTKTSKGK